MTIAFYQIDTKGNLHFPIMRQYLDKAREALRANLSSFVVNDLKDFGYDYDFCEVVTSASIEQVNAALHSV